VYAASELDAELRIAMLNELTQAVQCQRMAGLVGWPLVDHDRDRENGEDVAVEIVLGVYSDGRRRASKKDIDEWAAVISKHFPEYASGIRLSNNEIENHTTWPRHIAAALEEEQ
jgi:hypothetical protein